MFDSFILQNITMAVPIPLGVTHNIISLKVTNTHHEIPKIKIICQHKNCIVVFRIH